MSNPSTDAQSSCSPSAPSRAVQLPLYRVDVVSMPASTIGRNRGVDCYFISCSSSGSCVADRHTASNRSDPAALEATADGVRNRMSDLFHVDVPEPFLRQVFRLGRYRT
jgi:hypothetical protein